MVANVLPTTHSRGLVPVWEVPVAVGLGVAAVLAAGTGPVTMSLLYLAAVTPALVRSDLTVLRLPNRLVLPAYVVLLVALVAQGFMAGQFPLVAALSGVGYFGLLFALSVAGGMGMGDVKLAGALGLSAGMLGVEAAIISPLLAFLAGGVAATITLARGSRGSRIPFGPFILVGFMSFLLLTPLALTSNHRALRWLGAQRWQRLHRTVYAVAGLVVLHFFWMRAGKQDFGEVLAYGSFLGLLLGWRIWRRWRSQRIAPGDAAGSGEIDVQRPKRASKHCAPVSR